MFLALHLLSTCSPLAHHCSSGSYEGGSPIDVKKLHFRSQKGTRGQGPRVQISTTDKLDRENSHFIACEATITALEENKHSLFHFRQDVDANVWSSMFAASADLQSLLEGNRPFLYPSLLPERPVDTPSSPARPTSASPQRQSHLRSTLNPAAIGHRRVRSADMSQLRGRDFVAPSFPKLSETNSSDVAQPELPTSEASWDIVGSDFDSNSENGSTSAASVVRSLISSMRDHFDPQSLLSNGAFDFLVGDEDIPQSLLPLTLNLRDLKSQTDDEVPARVMHLRGSMDWAPPRQQIILHVQARTVAKPIAIQEQGYRCAGCGLRVELNYIKVGSIFFSCLSPDIEV